MIYKAFISYSHSADDKLAPALQSALHRFAKPFYRLRAIKVFRDKTSLHLTPELWPLIQQALANSEYFLLLCSPDAAKSHWVQNEVAEWFRLNGNADKLLLVLTEGEIIWDDSTNDFDWQRTNALPPNLKNTFRREPLYSDLRWARQSTDLSLRNPQFLDEIGSLGATLHGKSKDEMIGNDVRQHRLFKSVSAAAIVLLLALTATASSTAFYAVKQRNEARRQTVEAERQRQTAVVAAEKERQAAERERQAAASEKIARDNEEKQRKQAELATENEKAAKNQAEDRRREAERQRQIADDRRREAERQQNLATSRELAASADSQLGADPELSVLLSMAAHDRTPTEESTASLRRALLRSHVRATFHYFNSFKTAAFTPNGKWLILVKDRAELVEPETWRVIKTLERPTQHSSVSAVTLNRDGSKALALSYSFENNQSTARIFETDTWQTIRDLHIADDDQLTNALFSPDGTLVGTWSALEVVPRIWNVQTGQATSLGSEKTRVASLVFSADGRRVLTLGGREARVWESDTGKLISRTPCSASSLFSHGLFTPDGKYAVVVCDEVANRTGEVAKVLDPGTGQTITKLTGHAGFLTHVTASPDGQWLVTTSADKTARVWKVGTWESVAILHGHTGQLWEAEFSGDGSVLVTSGDDDVTRVWQTGSWNQISVLHGRIKSLPDVAVSFDGRRIATIAKDSSARVWEVDNGEGLATIDGFGENGGGSALPTAFSPDGKLFATRSSAGLVQIREVNTDRLVKELGRGNFLAFSPDSNRVFTSGRDYVVEMWDTHTWQMIRELRGHEHEVLDISFSGDGKWVVTAGGYDNTARVWNASSGESVAVLQGHTWRVMRAIFSPDDRWIATASYDKTARIWEVGTWKEVAVLRGHSEELFEIAFSPDGRRIVTASMDNTARLWETNSWRAIATLTGHTDQLNDATFSPDSRLVLTASWDKTARLWDAATGKPLSVLTGHTGMVNSGRFSPDGNLITTAGDTTVRVWDVRTGTLVTVLPIPGRGASSHGSPVTVRGAIFDPTGRQLMVASDDGITRVYSWELFAPIEKLLALARTRVTRDFTAEEKQRFLHQAIPNEQLAPPSTER